MSSLKFRSLPIFLLFVLLPAGGCGAVIESSELVYTPYRQTPCGRCIADACAAPITRCGADSGCASWMKCIWDCPQDGQGEADAHCEATCTASLSESGRSAAASVVACRTTGAGAFCEACGIGISSDPLFHQSCNASQAEADINCQQCEKAWCCESRQEYEANPASRALLACWKGCPPAGKIRDFSVGELAKTQAHYACRTQCRSTNRTGILALAAHTTCAAVKCPASCANVDLKDPKNRCLRCTQSRCLEHRMAITRSLDALDAEFCIQQCNDTRNTALDCIADCFSRHPKGIAPLNAFYVCANELCVSQCTG